MTAIIEKIEDKKEGAKTKKTIPARDKRTVLAGKAHKSLIGIIDTEKSILEGKERKYYFKVNPRVNKSEVKKAVEEYYGVKVEKVNVMRYVGKNKRFGTHFGTRVNVKKAVVTLKEGEVINV